MFMDGILLTFVIKHKYKDHNEETGGEESGYFTCISVNEIQFISISDSLFAKLMTVD